MSTFDTDRQSGFTLIEVLISIVILAIGIFSVHLMQLSSIRGNHTAMILTNEANWASFRIEQLLSLPYNSDSNGRDDDGDLAVDEADEQFVDGAGTNNGGVGLNDAPPNTDGILVSPDGNYTIYWNVADNFPVANMKTMRVFVQNNFGTTKTVSFTNCKTNF